ncbi:MAG: type II TA system antitoxin MqsA family protein [Burkholderiales bacterium]
MDGLLTGAEITVLRQQYQLTQSQAARLFGGGPVAFSKYENDDVAQSEFMDNLLRLVRRSAEAFWQLVEENSMAAEFTRKTLMATMRRGVQIHVRNEARIVSGRATYKPVQLDGYSSETQLWNRLNSGPNWCRSVHWPFMVKTRHKPAAPMSGRWSCPGDWPGHGRAHGAGRTAAGRGKSRLASQVNQYQFVDRFSRIQRDL